MFLFLSSLRTRGSRAFLFAKRRKRQKPWIPDRVGDDRRIVPANTRIQGRFSFCHPCEREDPEPFSSQSGGKGKNPGSPIGSGMTEELFPRTRESRVVSYAGYPGSEPNKGPEGCQTKGGGGRVLRGFGKRTQNHGRPGVARRVPLPRSRRLGLRNSLRSNSPRPHSGFGTGAQPRPQAPEGGVMRSRGYEYLQPAASP